MVEPTLVGAARPLRLIALLLLLLPITNPQRVVEVDGLPAFLDEGDAVASAAAFCDAHGFGNTPDGLPCARVVAADLVARQNRTRADAGVHARVLYDRGRYGEAAAVAAMASEPTPQTLGLAGAAHLALGNNGRAAAAYAAARALSTVSDLDLDANHGLAVFRAGGDALPFLDAVLGKAPAHAPARAHRALVYAERGQLDATIADLEVAAAVSRTAESARQLGLALLDRGGVGDGARGLASLEAALAADPADLGARHGRDRAAASLEVGDDVSIATFASDGADCGLKRLLASAGGFGHDPAVLGLDTPVWANGAKLGLLADYAESLDPETILVALDGYDVVVSGGRRAFRSLFERFEYRERGAPFVLVSADQTFYYRGPDERCFGEEYPPAAPGSPYRFLNSGSLAGRARHVAAALRHALAAHGGDGWSGVSDQTLLHRQFVIENAPCEGGVRRTACVEARVPCSPSNPPPRLVLDAYQELFGNTGGRAFLRDFAVVGGALANDVTGTRPLVLHCPGAIRYRAEFDRLAALGWDAAFGSCDDGAAA